jgi:hypothetical protein
MTKIAPTQVQSESQTIVENIDTQLSERDLKPLKDIYGRNLSVESDIIMFVLAT